MTYDIKRLTLLEPLHYSPAAPQEGEKMTRYTTRVGKKDMNPRAEDYLVEPFFCGHMAQASGERADSGNNGTDNGFMIPAGVYAFVQGETGVHSPLDAAEALWLECVWREYEPLNDTIYMREIPHGGGTVFQLFREIKP